MRISKVLPLLLTLCFAGCPIFGQVDTQDVKAIRFGKLIDGTGKVSTNAIVIVKGDRECGHSNPKGSTRYRSFRVHRDAGNDRRAHASDLLVGQES
jgi:hypothetical protein